MLLLFDLDHTLVHTRKACDPDFDFFVLRLCDGEALNVHVRPYAVPLLQFLVRACIPFGVWTLGTPEYAEAVVDGLTELAQIRRTAWQTVRSRAHVRRTVDGFPVKDLHDLENELDEGVLLVDDDPIHLRCPGNVERMLLAPPFDLDDPAVLEDDFLRRVAERIDFFRRRRLTRQRRAPHRPQSES